MRFLIEYKDFKSKEVKNKTLNVLDTFLNEHLIDKYHGQTFDTILVRFINNSPATRKLKNKSLYKIIAEIELTGDFKNSNKLNFEEFQIALLKIEEAIKKVRHVKLKESLDYKEGELLNDYYKTIEKAPKNLEELKGYAREEEKIKFDNDAKRSDCLMYRYKINPTELNRNIVGIRIYDQFENGMLAPFDYIYSELFSNLLRRAEVKLPNYSEIYVNIGETIEDAKQEISLETWHKYTYAALNISKYVCSDKYEKSKMLFESVCDGLRLIAEFDHLEKEKIEKVINYIKNNGEDIDLVYTAKENKNYRAEVIYKVPKDYRDKADYRLKVTDLKSGNAVIVHIDFIDMYWAPYSFGKILIKKDEIVIKGRESFRAEISRKQDKLPSEYRFKIPEIF
ncbi:MULTISPECIES: hypothetical protein [Bacillus]|uniref:hypothetical protein n=1 Tax=Bacillus TaxID=1386 RepID=UPI0004692B9E|nr:MULTISPECIES: hypothetical protein [Bacillus]MED1409832.1 hypothetical protein [Bacillus paramycoides]MED1465086.1 hypothetical protein [Bacillus paramycoides]MED1493613.1 hypothetical protein [Bacillus paramycoides]